MHPSILEMLRSHHFDPDYQPNITRAEILSSLPKFSGLIVRSKTPIDKELLSAGTSLQFIGRAGAGLDNIDVEEATRLGIEIVNAPEGNRDALGEHAVALLLGLLNHIGNGNKDIRHFIWEREANRGHEVSHLTVGLFGYGNMAQAFARRLKGFGCRILAYDKYKTDFSDTFVKEATLEELFEECQVFSLHTPLTAETKGFISYEFLSRFKNPFWLVNTSRGEVMPVKDILRLLQEGKCRGAALDVLEFEKFDKLSTDQKATYEELFALGNVILSPHVAGWSFESYRKINEVLVSKIIHLNLQD